MRRVRDDAGLTLAEMMVVMMLMGLLSALVLTFVTSVERQMTTSRVMNENTNQASAATNETTRLLRGAVPLQVQNQADQPAFIEAGPTTVTFYTVVDTDAKTTTPMMVRLEVTAAGDLVEKRWLATNPGTPGPYWTFPTTAQTPSTTRTVAHGMTARPGSGQSLFTYLTYDKNGNQVTLPFANGSLTAANRALVAAVQVDAKAQTGTRGTPTLLTTVVGLRNVPAGSH